MRYNKRSQVSIEFLTTYGWIFMIILVTIGILINYGFLNPSKYLPERVEFSEQLKCEEFFLDLEASEADQGIVSLRVRNNFVRPINITKLYTKVNSEKDYINCDIQEVPLALGQADIIACNHLEINDNTKNTLNFIITFKRDASGSAEHNVSGVLFAEPIKGEYCTNHGTGGVSFAHCEDNIFDCGETLGVIPVTGGGC
jgi:hypothetical protein